MIAAYPQREKEKDERHTQSKSVNLHKLIQFFLLLLALPFLLHRPIAILLRDFLDRKFDFAGADFHIPIGLAQRAGTLPHGFVIASAFIVAISSSSSTGVDFAFGLGEICFGSAS